MKSAQQAAKQLVSAGSQERSGRQGCRGLRTALLTVGPGYVPIWLLVPKACPVARQAIGQPELVRVGVGRAHGGGQSVGLRATRNRRRTGDWSSSVESKLTYTSHAGWMCKCNKQKTTGSPGKPGYKSTRIIPILSLSRMTKWLSLLHLFFFSAAQNCRA